MKQRNNCPECPFKSRTIGSRGPKDAKVVIVGESPGTTEIKEGRPFIGLSGELLKKLLAEANIDEESLYITNAIKCLPPRSKDATGARVKDGVMNDACRACQGALAAELGAFPRKLIITVGSAAARSLSGKWGYSIMKNRGQVFESPLSELGVLPTYHPAYLLRNPSATPQVRSDLKKARDLINGKKFPTPTTEYIILGEEDEINEVLQRDLKTCKGIPRLILDIESTGLDRHRDKFRCIGFIFEHKLSLNGHNVGYILTGKDRGGLVKYLFRRVAQLSKRYAKNIEFVWHNGKFDTSFLRAKNIPEEHVRVDQDTLLLSYTLDETGQRHSLEQCIMDHLGLPSYKDETKEWMKAKKGRTFADIPSAMLYERNIKDIVYSGLLFQKLYPQVVSNNRKPHLKQVYEELLIPASNTLATIELNGMPIDQSVLAETHAKLTADLKPFLRGLRELANDPLFNPNSPQQVLRLANDVLNLGVLRTDEDTLKKFKDKSKFVRDLLEYRGLQKQLGTYITSFQKYGARVHTSFLLHGTVTGRLSSSSPNMQNIPKEDLVRRHFRTRVGRVFVSFDYSQAELRSLAVLSGDKNLINIFKSGKDMHATVAAEVYGELFTRESEYLPDGKTENPVYGKYRRYAKTVNFGIVYGATEPTLQERLGITWDEAHTLIEGWFDMFPDAYKYMQQCRRAPVESRPLITVFGRQRRFYVVTNRNMHGQENEAGNFPHQSMCSDFTLAAAVEIDQVRRTLGLPGNACQVNIIHDDNMFECDDDDNEIVKLAQIVRPIMEGVPRKKGITDLPFKSDAKKGIIWSQMQKIRGL